jgi:hypothetical protein
MLLGIRHSLTKNGYLGDQGGLMGILLGRKRGKVLVEYVRRTIEIVGLGSSGT